MFRTIAKHVPPPPGIEPPVLWGTEDRLVELLGDAIFSLDTTRREFVLRYLSARHFVGHFREYFGPMRTAFESLDEAGQKELAKDLETLLESRNISGGDTLVVPSAYLEAVAARK